MSPASSGPPGAAAAPGTGAPEPTGHRDVDAALDRLADIEALPVAEHVGVYDEVQQRLAAAMDDAEDRGSTVGPG